MSELERTRVILRIRASTMYTAELELCVGDKPTAAAMLDLSSLGITQQDSRYPDENDLDHVLRQQNREFHAHLLGTGRSLASGLPPKGEDDCLWLEHPGARGLLALLPWERWLTAALEWPVRRLPYLPSRRTVRQGLRQIALCCSQPASKSPLSFEEVASVLAALLQADTHCRVHVFLDQQYFHRVQTALFWGERVVFHDPEAAAEYAIPKRQQRLSGETGRTVDSPWLLWMLNALNQTALDAVHFVVHTYFAEGRGALAFAQSPVFNQDDYWARFVGPLQLSAFLDQCGAATLGLTSPSLNFSPVGARALADQVAQRRPGAVLLHESEVDFVRRELVAAYGYLAGTLAANPMPSVTLYADSLADLPEQVPGPKPASQLGPPPGLQLERVRAACERIVERTAADVNLLKSSGVGIDSAGYRGSKAALRYVNELFDRQFGRGEQQ